VAISIATRSRPTLLHDRRRDNMSLDEVGRIATQTEDAIWLFLPNPSKLLKERFRGQESAEGLLFARPKRRFRWIEEPFEGDARTVVRIKVPKHGRCDEFLH